MAIYSFRYGLQIIYTLVGNFKQEITMSNTTQEYVNKFSELVDAILYAVLFMLIAFVLVVIDLKAKYMLVGLSLLRCFLGLTIERLAKQ